MPARFGQAQRPGGGRPRHLPPYDVRDAGQLVLRRLLQEGGDRVGLGTAPRRLRTARRADVRHGVRRFGGGRRAVRPGGLRLLAPVPACGSHHPRQQARQLLGDGRDGTLRTLLGNPLRPARRGGDRRQTGPRDGQREPSAGDRDLEPRLHAVQPHGKRFAGGGTSRAQRRYGHGLRAPVHDPARQEVELRHRRFPAHDRPYRGDVGQEIRRGCQGRRGHARDRRPPAGHRLFDRRRPAAVERQGGLRHPPHPAPRRALRLYLPRLHRADALPPGSRTGGADGRPVPRAEGAAGTYREGYRGGGGVVPADAGHGHQPAGRRRRAHAERGPRTDLRQGGFRALRYVRLPDRPHGADRPRAGRRRGPRGFREGVAGPEGAFAQRRGRRYRRLGGADSHPGERLHGL